MKKLINAPGDVVPDMLRGLAMTDERLRIMPAHNIVVRADYAELRQQGKVALISGGGAGHEPAHAGYVGAGMLTAAVTGAVFTSPSVDAVLAAIRLVTGPAGCLLIVKNYTGDRLNFGLAAAIARNEGLAVEMVLVADDVALNASSSRVGARGLAGTVLAHKIAGAAAENGTDLAHLVDCLTGFVSGIGTMGVALSACINPSAGEPSFDLGAMEMEYGLGIHGEQGRSRELLAEANEVATRLVRSIIGERGFEPGSRVALMLNGLGGTPPSEIAIMTGSAIAAARAHGLQVERVMSGSFLTALEMAGCSISLAVVDEHTIDLLDQPTEAPAWIRPAQPVDAIVPLEEPSAGSHSEKHNLPCLSSDGQKMLRGAIEQTARALQSVEADLTALDRIVGDGDLGISLARGTQVLLDECDKIDMSHPASALHDVSNILRRAIGGTSGPLYAAFTLAVSASLRDVPETPSLADWARAMQAGCVAISQLGGARIGDSTMLDALIPAADALTAAAEEGNSPQRALAAAVDAAREGTRSTASLNPQVGRASYLGVRTIGHVDPGAEAVTVWLEAIRHQFS